MGHPNLKTGQSPRAASYLHRDGSGGLARVGKTAALADSGYITAGEPLNESPRRSQKLAPHHVHLCGIQALLSDPLKSRRAAQTEA